jgi:hypothetical protein
VWAVLLDEVERQRAAIDARLKDEPFPRREYLSWVLLFEYAASRRAATAALFGSRGSAALLQRYQAYLVKLYEDNLAQGVYSAGLDLPPVFLAQYMTGALVRLLVWWSETDTGYTPRQMADLLYEAAFRAKPPAG